MNGSGYIFALLAWVGMAWEGVGQGLRAETNGLRSYACSGVVQWVVPEQGLVTIHHQAIPQFMPEMTMDFTVRNTNELQGVSPGDDLTFSLRVLPDEAWIENVHCVGHGKPVASRAAQAAQEDSGLQPGQAWPDGELLDEHGNKVHFSDFRGRTLAFNFFFARCPLPNYCPWANRTFAEARRLLAATPEASTNGFFLSISFDPDFDTPALLAGYAQSYREGDTNRWLFASASEDALNRVPRRLGLIVQRQRANITHNLRTVVLDPQGRVYRQFDGNNWTAQELARAMREAWQSKVRKGSP